MVVSIVSVIAVVAAAGLIARFSKLPPVALVIVADTLPASTIHVVARRGHAHAAAARAGGDGDRGAVAQRDVHRRLRRAGERRGVDDRCRPRPRSAWRLRLTVVVSTVSVTPWWRAAGLTTRFSKLPPVAVRDRGRHAAGVDDTRRRSARPRWPAALAPAAIVIVAPLLSVTVTADCAGAVQRGGVGDGAAFGHAAARVSDTVVVLTVSVIAWSPAWHRRSTGSKPPPLRC